MKLTFIGHSACKLDIGNTEILIDPFISDNPQATLDADSFQPSYIILSHAHGDHVGDTEAIAKRTGAKIISSFEIVNYFGDKGIDGHPMNPGGGYDFDFGRVTFTPAWHSSSFPDGTYGGMPMGIIIEAEQKRIYHAGDTALFSDMALIARKPIDLALLPIGDNFTMGPEDALEAVKLLKSRQVVPIHYNTFDPIKQNPQQFKDRVSEYTESECTVLAPGDVIDL